MLFSDILAAILTVSSCVASGGNAWRDDPEHHFINLQNSLHPYVERAREVPDLADTDEDALRIPRGTLSPGFVYEDHLDKIIQDHINSPKARFAEIEAGDHSTYFATPWRIRIPTPEQMARGARVGEVGPKRKGVIFFDLDQGGEVRPSWHANFKDEPMEGTVETFWQFIHRMAELTTEDLKAEFGELHIGL